MGGVSQPTARVYREASADHPTGVSEQSRAAGAIASGDSAGDASYFTRERQSQRYDQAVAARIFDRVTINPKELLSVNWQRVAVSSCCEVVQEALLAFAHLHATETQTTIQYDAWEDFFISRGLTDDAVSAESTWQDLLAMWLASHQNDSVLEWVAHRGPIRFARQDMQITAVGVQDYLQHPDDYRRPVQNSEAPAAFFIKQGDALAQTTWPDAPSQITLLRKAGVALTLDVDAGARVVTRQSIRDGALQFSAATPLLYLEGFHFSVNAVGGMAKRLAGWGQALTGLVSRDFDATLYGLSAITVMHNRLQFAFKGQASQNIINPVPANDYLFADVTFLFKQILRFADPSGALVSAIFDESGSIKTSVSVSLLQDVLLSWLQNPGEVFDSRFVRRILSNQGLRQTDSEIWVSGVEADLSVPALSVIERLDHMGFGDTLPILGASLSDGRVYGRVRGSEMTANGDFQIAVQTNSTFLQGQNDDHAVTLGVHFAIVPEDDLAQIRVTLPETNLVGGDFIRGLYAGQMDVHIPLENERVDDLLAAVASQDWQTVLQTLAGDAIVTLTRDHQDFLQAALYFQNQIDAEGTRFVADYDLQMSNAEGQLVGVVEGGTLSFLRPVATENPYLSGEFEITARQAAIGGITRLFGENVSLHVTMDDQGRYLINPAFTRGTIDSVYDVETSEMFGQIMVEPVRSAAGAIVGYDVTVDELGVDIPQAEIVFKNNRRVVGQTRAVVRSGQWHVAVPRFMDLFVDDVEWVGQGTLELENFDNSLTLFNSDQSQMARFENPRINSQFKVDLIRFNPVHVVGHMDQLLDHGTFDYQTDDFILNTDVSGGVDIRDAVYPVVSFHVDDNLANQTDTSIGVATQSDELNVMTRSTTRVRRGQDVITQTFAPHLAEMDAADARLLRGDDLALDLETTHSIAESIIDLRVLLEDVALYSGGEYKSRRGKNVAALPILKGFWKIVNPRVQEGTDFDLPENEIIVDNHIQPFNLELNQPIKFLGHRITGLAVEPARRDVDRAAKRVVLKTPRRDINPLALLRLAYPFKMSGFYRRVNKRLKLEWTGDHEPVTLRSGEMPTDLGALTIFCDELIASLGWEDRVDLAGDQPNAPIVDPEELHRLQASARLQLREFDAHLLSTTHEPQTVVRANLTYNGINCIANINTA